MLLANSTIEHKLVQYVGACRFVWNKALALVKQDDEDYRTIVTISKMNGGNADGITTFFKFNPYRQLSAILTQWKQEPKTAFLNQVYSKSLQIVFEELGYAVTEAKSKANPNGVSKQYPVFKKHGIKDSFSFNSNIKHDAENRNDFVHKVTTAITKSYAYVAVEQNIKTAGLAELVC